MPLVLTLLSLKKWWDIIISEGQKLGYYVNESKSWLIIKDRIKLETAKQIFDVINIKFTCEGKRHLGTVRPQSINCLVRVSFVLKNGAGGRVEVKKFGFF